MEKGDFNINSYVCLVSEHAVDCGILAFSSSHLLKVHVKPVLIQMEHQVENSLKVASFIECYLLTRHLL